MDPPNWLMSAFLFVNWAGFSERKEKELLFLKKLLLLYVHFDVLVII